MKKDGIAKWESIICQSIKWTAILIVSLIILNKFPDILRSMQGSNISKFNILNIAGFELESPDSKLAIFSLPAKQYWLETGIVLKDNQEITISPSGIIFTGQSFELTHLETHSPDRTSERKLHLWAESHFKFQIAQRSPSGKLLHPHYERIINNTDCELIQQISDLLLIKPKNSDSCSFVDYGTLLCCAIDPNSLLDLKKNPWSFSENIIPIQKTTTFKVNKGLTLSWNKDNTLTIPQKETRLYFIINDSVIPDFEPNSCNAQFPCTSSLLQATKTDDSPVQSLEINKNDSCYVHLKFFEETLKFAYLLEQKEQENSCNKNQLVGSRDFFYFDNDGSLTVSVLIK